MNKPLPEDKARQGRRGFPVLVILIVGLVLAALVWWGAHYYGLAVAPEPGESIELSE